ncbi:MAG: N-6 DNA methylase [Ignavibacteriaceae bacterium]
MLDNETKRRIDTARDILVGKVPDPKSQVEQITIALIYKFMDDMDAEAEELGAKRKFFSGEFDRYGWKKLMAPDLGGFDVLTLYAEAIQKMNINPNIPQLFRDIFKNAYLPYRDPETLKSFLKVIDDFDYSHSEKLGDAFEYLLSVLGSQGDAGQFRTPRHIIDFMVDIIDPKKDETILDPACGTAGFLISSYKHILKHNSSNFIPEKDKEAFEQTDVSIAELSAGGIKRYNGDKLTPDERAKLSKNIKGYDISPDMVRLSLVNLYLHGFTDPKIFEYDTLTQEDNWNEYSDIVLANPPFMSPKGGIKPHKRFSIQSNRSEVLFVDYMVEHLTPNGKAAIIVPEGIIFQSGNAYKQLRKMLVENYLFAVVSLPAGVFQPYSGVKTSILLIDKALNKKTDKILFVKIENDGFDLGAQRRPNNKSQLPTAVKLVKEYISGCNSALDLESILTDKFGPNNLWNIATKEKIAENDDWNLSGERYKNKIIQLGRYKVVSLGEIAEVIAGQSPEGQFYNEVREGTPFYQGKTEFSEMFLGEPKTWTTKITKMAIRGDILISVRAPVGPVNISKEDICIGRGLAAIRVNENIVDKFFLFYFLQENQDKIQGNLGATFASINKKEIEQIQIPLPPLEIQKEIVEEIEGWQKIIDGARQVVENYKPQIDIDPEWPMVELGEVCEKITDGTHRTPEYKEEGIPFLRVTDITQSDGSKKFISQEEHQELIKRCKPEKEDVLYSKNGTIGVAKLIDWDYEFSIFVSLALLKPKKEILVPKYLEIFLNSDNAMRQAVAHSKSGTVTNLHLIEIKQMKIPLPDTQTQNQIVSVMGKEFELVGSNKELISIFEQKIKDKIAKVWGE